MRTSLLFITLFVFNLYSFGQKASVGQFSIGIEANMFTIKNFSPSGENLGLFTRAKSSNPLGFTVDYNQKVGRKMSLNLGLGYTHIQNATLSLRKAYSNYNTSVRVHDLTQLQANNLQFNFGFKAFYLHAPLGNYFLFNVNYNHLNSTLYQSWNVTQFDDKYNYYSYTPFEVNTQHLGAELGFGFIKVIGKNMFIDYGAKVNFEFYAPSAGEQEIYRGSGAVNYTSESPLLNEFNQKLLQTNLLQFFVKVGWNKNMF